MKNMDQATALVPFGKYKGQPVEVMQMDTAYCDWLSKQSWFREQYGNVYNQVIINNFTEPTETPEHNRLQMRFLDEAFIDRFISRKLRPAISAKEFAIEEIQFEHRGWDVFIDYKYSKEAGGELDRFGSVCFEIKPCMGDDFPAVLRQMKNNRKRQFASFAICIIDEFTACGATFEQVNQMFRLSKFSLMRFSDFEE
jgi:uncharacterized protein (DUF3820 family)